MKPGRIRSIALCVFKKDDLILVQEGYDPIRKLTFYRPLGGGIEFGEHSRETAVREIREELKAEITNLTYLGLIENIFTYHGEQGHEIVLLYIADLVDSSFYEKSVFEVYEEGSSLLLKAVWKSLADFQSGETPLYPTGLLELLEN
jgi:8-oxo-dGTP pyrophosphatase MutT (NUDIX family)